MTTASLLPERRLVRLTWADRSTDDFPYLWLRDNCPTAYHPETEERTLDLLEVPADAAPDAVAVEDGGLRVAWGPAKDSEGEGHSRGHESRFSLDWLAAHRPGRPLADPAAVPRQAWRGNAGAEALPRADADAVLRDDAALETWLRATKETGLSLVEGLSDAPEAGMEVARRIGFLRKTNFGETFSVESKPQPNNLAYTAVALPLHTDLPNQELPPGFQFLHCQVNTATGGGSVFADGLALAEDLRDADPEAFELLSRVAIPFRFHDADYDIRQHRPVIQLDGSGAVTEIRWNAHIAGVFDMPAEEIEPYYRAYRRFMAMTRDPAYRVELTLRAGQMAVFDNRRVLHGRAAFDPGSGQRRLHGCYVDRGEFDSRLRILDRIGSGRARTAPGGSVNPV
jgi:gamma-butyrobetaine dioxygenase